MGMLRSHKAVNPGPLDQGMDSNDVEVSTYQDVPGMGTKENGLF